MRLIPSIKPACGAMAAALFCGALIAAIFAASGPARAHASFATERVRVELMAETAGIPASGGTVWVALHQEIAPGWHTYWKNPGDSGEPTDVDWSLPQGFSVGDAVWQPPERQPYGPLVNFGYSDQATFLFPLSLPAGLSPGDQVELAAHVYWLVCADVCIPEDGRVDIQLMVVADAPGPNFAAVDVFARARELAPQASPWDAQFEVAGENLRVALLGPDFAGPLAEGRITNVALFPQMTGLIDNAAEPRVRFGAEGMTLSVPIGPRIGRGATPETIRGLITIEEDVGGEMVSRAIEFTAAPGAVPTGAMTQGFARSGGSGEGIGLGQAALFALLGGLILNLMPCVFPIVFLKALTFVSVAHERPWRVRFHGLFYTAGILVSFTLIALLLIVLRAAGQEIGWGFQLQSPEVVAAFAILLFAVGLNLSGIFTLGGSVMGAGGSLAERRGYSGSFFTGVLAVIVAAPCTAPFMGIALGFGLTQPAVIGLAIFLALGFGMALPYLLLSFAPALLKLLPRPGAWMERLKQFLALPIYAWVVYLLWVLAQQVSFATVGLLIGVLMVIAVGLWALGARHGPWRAALPSLGGLVALVVIIGIAVSLLPRAGGASGSGLAAHAESVPSVAYEPDALARLREDGRIVFVNFTAAWCITCLLNERVVFSDARVVDRLQSEEVVYMKGDWTNRNTEIARALEQFGRPGVPLYVVYTPGSAPRVLPQVLTAEVLLDALGE